jgi:hypothetical protein
VSKTQDEEGREPERQTGVGAKAEVIVDAIIADLSDRRGLRQEWEGCDEEIQAEIRSEWILIARRVIEMR